MAITLILSSLVHSSLKIHRMQLWAEFRCCLEVITWGIDVLQPQSSWQFFCSIIINTCPSQKVEVHRGCGTTHAQMRCHPELKSNVCPRKIWPPKYCLSPSVATTMMSSSSRWTILMNYKSDYIESGEDSWVFMNEILHQTAVKTEHHVEPSKQGQ